MSWVHMRGPVIQANGRLIFEDDLRSRGLLCNSLNSEPASELGLLTVWSLCGNLEMARCWEMSTLHAGYIPQSDIGQQQWFIGFHNELSLCVKCCRMVDIIPRWQLSLSGPIQSDHLSIEDCDDTAFGAGTLTWQDSTFLESRSWWGHDCGKLL